MATRDRGITTVAVVFLTLHLILTDAAGPSLTFVTEQQLDGTLGYNALSAKMIPLSTGGSRLCVGGAASATGRFMSRDIDASGNIPSNSNSEVSPILPTSYVSAISDVSVMDSKINKCLYSVLRQESASASSYAIVQAGGTPNPIPIAYNTNILTVNASSTNQTYLLNADFTILSTTFNDLNFSGVTSMCGAVAGDSTVLYAYGRKSASVQVGFDGAGVSTDTTYIGYKVACDAMNTAQWIVCWDTQDATSIVSCRTSQGYNKQHLQSQPNLYVTRPSVAYLNTNGVAAVVMQTSVSIQVVVVDSTLNELLTLQINTSSGQLVADAMNNVLSVAWTTATGVYARTYLFDSGLVVAPNSITPDGTNVVPLASPTSGPAATPGQSTPSGSPITPSSSPVTGQTPQSNTPKSESPKADGPVANGTASTGPNGAVGDGPTPTDSNAASADGKVLGPAIAIPLAAVGAGVFLLVFFLKKRNKKNDKKTDGDAHEGEGNLSVLNPTADPGRYSAIVGAEKNEPSHYGAIATAAKDDGINPTAIQPSEIDKRMQIPYKSLRFTKEIGAGSYGKVFVGEWRGAQVAIKVNNTITDIDGFLGEAKLTLGITPHPNLVQTFGVSLDGPNPCIVLEFCGGGSLDNVVFDPEKHVTDEQRRDYALKIAYGLLHLHNNNIVHRDLAARNILLTNDGQPKISDFGMSRIIQEESSQGRTKTSFGPIRWMAPESLKDKSYSTKSDVWSYGILLYELVAGNEPHVNEDQLSIAVRIRDTAATPVIPSQCDPVLKQVMEMCWKPNPNDRPSMETIAEFLRQD